METYEWTCETESAEATRAIGARLGQLLRNGDVLALIGDLGAGKTVFTQGVAEGLGIRVPVTSPTFVLINCYRAADGRVLQHADCYRLTAASAEMWDIGLTDLMVDDQILIIEWADRILDLLPTARLEISLTYLDANRRRLVCRAHGAHYIELLRQIACTDTGHTVPELTDVACA